MARLPVPPAHEDPVAAGAAAALGGAPGRHARLVRQGLWSPVRVVVALTLLACVLGFLQKTPCRTQEWTDNYQYTRLCYNDPVPLYGGRGFSGEGLPYLDNDLEYPVVIGGLMQVAAWAVEPFDEAERGKRFFDVTAAMMTGFAVVVAVTTVRLAGRRRPWDALLLATAPGLVLAVHNNWDMAAAALVGLGLLAWARERPVLSGVALGLATATKLYPVLLLGPLVLLCVRAGRLKQVAVTAAAAAGAWAVVNLPVAYAAPEGWRHFYVFSSQREADWGSIWYVLQHVFGPLDAAVSPGAVPSRLNTVASLLFLLCCVGVAILVLRAPRRPRVAQVAFLTVLAFMLTNKVYSPQFVIWLLPLAVLARPRWGTFLLWQASEAVAFVAIWYYLVGVSTPGEGIGAAWYFAALLARDAVLLLLANRVVQEMLHPDRDVVRRDGIDDPAGGVLDGAPDWPSLPAVLRSGAVRRAEQRTVPVPLP